MVDIEIYATRWCGYCVRARALLREKGVAFREIDVGKDPGLRQEMTKRSRRFTVPQIFVDGESIGGYRELAQLEMQGELDVLLGIESG